jgi:hypothetical protein
MKRALLPTAVLIAVLGVPATALASWGSPGSGGATTRALVMPTGNAPTVSVLGRNVTVSWPASSFSGGPAVNAYRVRRYNGALVSQPVGPSCNGSVAALTCAEAAVPAGTWTYTVTPKQAGWLGAESSQSASATIAAASFSITSGTPVTSLPSSVSGSLSGYATGETLAFRLDDPNTGTVLAGSTVPGSIPAAGTAIASVTIPNGTTLGAHSIFAIGSGGTTASANVVVNDTTAPSVSAAVIGKSTGGSTGSLKQGAGYYVYANVMDPAPASGVASVSANVVTITTGATSVPLTSAGGPFAAGGVSYTYRSGLQTANGVLVAGAQAFTISATDNASNTRTQGGFSVTVDNTPPAASDVQTANVAGGTAGTAEVGDTLTYTFSEPVEPGSVLAGWNGSSTTTTVRFLNSGSNDQVQIWNAAASAQLPFGTVALGANHVSGGGATFSSSTMVMSGSTITVTLGTQSGATRSTAGGAMVWTPSTTPVDLAGNGCLAAPATETGLIDTDF